MVARPPVRLVVEPMRLDDVPALVTWFLAGSPGCGPVQGASPEFLDAVRARPWPGNVRELKAAVDVAAGGTHTCAVTQTGAVQCWGDNTFGQLGTGDNNSRNAATTVTGLATIYTTTTVAATVPPTSPTTAPTTTTPATTAPARRPRPSTRSSCAPGPSRDQRDGRDTHPGCDGDDMRGEASWICAATRDQRTGKSGETQQGRVHRQAIFAQAGIKEIFRGVGFVQQHVIPRGVRSDLARMVRMLEQPCTMDTRQVEHAPLHSLIGSKLPSARLTSTSRLRNECSC